MFWGKTLTTPSKVIKGRRVNFKDKWNRVGGKREEMIFSSVATKQFIERKILMITNFIAILFF